MTNMPVFRSGLGASQAHIALKKSVEIMNQAQHCAVLWFGEIMRRELYRELGYSTMRAYALEDLEFSSTKAGDFMRLAKKLEELPAVKEEMATGKIGYTVAREIATVADPANEKDWLKEAQEKSRRELIAQVRHARDVAKRDQKTNPDQVELMPRPVPVVAAAPPPVRIGFELTAIQNARYEAALAKIGHRGDKAQLLLDMVEALADTPESAPRGATARAPHQIHIHHCEECGSKTVQTPQGETPLTETQYEAACCDAEIHIPGQRNATTIPPRIRREVQTRDRHKCRRKGCHHTRHLHIHHVVPRARGGGNEIENLVTLCSSCHDLWHERGGNLQMILTGATTE